MIANCPRGLGSSRNPQGSGRGGGGGGGVKFTSTDSE